VCSSDLEDNPAPVSQLRDAVFVGTDGGTGNAYAVTMTPAPSAYTEGMTVIFKPLASNTGACTLNVNALGVKSIKDRAGNDPQAGEICAGSYVMAIYDAANNRFQLPASSIDQSAASSVAVPAGTIVPWAGGYFTNGSNAGYTNVLAGGNTVAEANAYLNALNWYVCDGAALNTGAGIFNGAGRYLPNLTDDRFIMGDTTAGVIGGSSTMAHTHTGPSHTHSISGAALTTAQIPDHVHGYRYYNAGGPFSGNYLQAAAIGTGDYTVTAASVLATDGGGGTPTGSTHDHGGVTIAGGTGATGASGTGATGAGGTGNTGGASDAENRPLFLSCFYIMKVQ